MEKIMRECGFGSGDSDFDSDDIKRSVFNDKILNNECLLDELFRKRQRFIANNNGGREGHHCRCHRCSRSRRQRRHLVLHSNFITQQQRFKTEELFNPATAVPISEYEEASRRLYKAQGICIQKISSPTTRDNVASTEQKAGAYVRCIASNMGLWTDATGYNSKRVAKFFIKEHNENEVMTVVDYCNQKHQQADLDLWAFEAYRCATAGRMGIWLREYVLSAKL
uniref:Odorant-binding protein 99d n=1 Tax=Bactrocera minax TaxID=104690 RepID=A0A3G2LEI2_9MUSC|nr:odorant-binding protein 99d [Bactrocera minax]